MDPSEVHPDLLGEALSRSGQRLAQLGSLLTSWAMVQARRIERRNAAAAAKSQEELQELRAQDRAARDLARAGWAPAEDRQWLSRAGLVDVARAWSAAAAYADADPGAATALARCEARLRQLHPYAMSWYDRQRAQEAGPFDAMQDALPLFARAPNARPGGTAAARPALAATAEAQAAATGPSQWEQPGAVSATFSADASQDPGAIRGRGAPDLAAESFPWTIAEAVRAGAAPSPQAGTQPRVAAPRPAARHSPAR
jgi:hypothetical protein